MRTSHSQSSTDTNRASQNLHSLTELQKAWQTPKTETEETSNPKGASLIELQSLRGLKET